MILVEALGRKRKRCWSAVADLETAGPAVAAGFRAERKVGKEAPSHPCVAEELPAHLHQVLRSEVAVKAAKRVWETEAASRRLAASGAAA